jgi:hypothetical protein
MWSIIFGVRIVAFDLVIWREKKEEKNMHFVIFM